MSQAVVVRAADREEKGENKNAFGEVSWEELSTTFVGA